MLDAEEKNDIKSINAFEMYCWRRMLRISWITKGSNTLIRQESNITIQLKNVVQQRITRYVDNILRNDGIECNDISMLMIKDQMQIYP